MPQDAFDDKSKFIQVMATRHQASTWANVEPDLCIHISSYGITRPLLVKSLDYWE